MKVRFKVKKKPYKKENVQEEPDKDKVRTLHEKKEQELAIARRKRAEKSSSANSGGRSSGQGEFKFRSGDGLDPRLFLWGILAILIWTPLPAASVYAWSVLIIELAALGLLALYVLRPQKPQLDPMVDRALKWPRVCFAGFWIVLGIQLIPWPNFVVKLLSPAAYSFRDLFMVDFSGTLFQPFSLIPAKTVQEALEILSYFIIGFIVLRTVRTREQVKKIFYVIAGMGIFQAFYGLFELYNPNPRILFYEKVHGLEVVTGTFVNRNHLSGYLEMAIPLALGLIITRIHLFSTEGLSWREKLQRLSDKGLGINLLLTLGVVIMGIGILLSQSRSGAFLLVFTFLVMFELTVVYFGRRSSGKDWAKNFIKVSFLIITLVALYVGIEATIERFADTNLLQEGRPVVWSNTLGMTRDFPLLGTGLGTFNEVYSAYENRWLGQSHYTHAHNDYLEYTAELGVVGMVFLLGGVVFLLATTFLVWRSRRHPEIKGLALGGMVAVINMMLHSIGDFNLHIPANMVVFTVILAATFRVVFMSRRKRA